MSTGPSRTHRLRTLALLEAGRTTLCPASGSRAPFPTAEPQSALSQREQDRTRDHVNVRKHPDPHEVEELPGGLLRPMEVDAG